MANNELRKMLSGSGIRHWELADAIGISSCSMSIWLRKELEGERKERVERALSSLLKERK